jgi:hypothetical protein
MPMKSNSKWLTTALFFNGAMLAGILLTLANRSNLPSVLPAAYGQVPGQANIAGGAGFYLMPAQMSGKQWGCYLMDVDGQTLTVYLYDDGAQQLKLAASRSFVHDRQLRAYNTDPLPREVEKLVQTEKDLASQQVGEQNKPKVPAN